MPYLFAIPVLAAIAAVGLALVIWGLIEHRSTRNASAGGTPLDAASFNASLGFAETLRVVPLKLLIGLDLLDLGLDVLAAPLVWVILDRAGLKSLRTVASLEALVPFTQPVPLLTLSWVVVRIGDLLRSPRSVGKGAAAAKSNGPRAEEAGPRPPRKRVANLAR